MYVFVCQLRASFTSFVQLLRCAHKHCLCTLSIIMKEYIERNNMQIELIRFRKKIDFLTMETSKWEYTFATDVFTKLGSLVSMTCRNCSVRAVRTESRSKRQFYSHLLLFSPFLTV